MQEGKELFPKVAENKFIFSDVSYTETWPAMEKLVEKGLVKSIGVSNFNSKQVDDILKIAKIPPVVNQVQYFLFDPSRKRCGQIINHRDIVG